MFVMEQKGWGRVIFAEGYAPYMGVGWRETVRNEGAPYMTVGLLILCYQNDLG